MKTIKIKLYPFIQIFNYLLNKTKKNNITISILRDVNSKLERICQRYKDAFEREREYNLNVRMRRRNRFWRNNNKKLN